MIKIDYIYIIHYHKEKERKKYLDSILPQFKIPYEFRSLFDRNSPELLSDFYFDQSEKNKNIKNEIMEPYGKKFFEGMPLEWGERGRAYRAVTLEHFKTYEHVIKNTNYKNILIFEDDVIFVDNFLNHLNEYLNTLPEDYDICYVGSGCNLKLPYQTDKILDLHHQYHSRCSDSYIIQKKAIEKIVTSALPFYGAIDWELNYLQALNKFNVYWTTTHMTYQGSQKGHYNSTFNIL